MPFVSCFSTHCVASLLLDGKFVQDVERASSAEVVIQSPDGRGVKFEFPTKGFDKAYAALRQSK
jgi:invasion protein IalB